MLRLRTYPENDFPFNKSERDATIVSGIMGKAEVITMNPHMSSWNGDVFAVEFRDSWINTDLIIGLKERKIGIYP